VALVLGDVRHAQGLAVERYPPRDALAELQPNLPAGLGSEPALRDDVELALVRDERHGPGRRAGVADTGVEEEVEKLARIERRVERERDLLEDRQAVVRLGARLWKLGLDFRGFGAHLGTVLGEEADSIL